MREKVLGGGWRERERRRAHAHGWTLPLLWLRVVPAREMQKLRWEGDAWDGFFCCFT